MTLPGDADGMRDTLGIGTVVAPVGSFRLKPAHTRTNGEPGGAGTEGPPQGACTPRLSPSPHPSQTQSCLRHLQDCRHLDLLLRRQLTAQQLLGLAPRLLGRLLADLFRALRPGPLLIRNGSRNPPPTNSSVSSEPFRINSGPGRS